MAETEAVHVRPPEPITISICRGNNLVWQRGSKVESVHAIVKVEFSDKVLGESPKVICMPDAPAEFNFSTTLNCMYDDPQAINEIAHKPVILTVIEVMPKERRQKEEKTNTLGQCTVDLLPLVKGETSFMKTLVINPVSGSSFSGIPPESPRPELEIVVTVNEPLLDQYQVNEGNLMTITVESMFSPPETWQLTGAHYYYAAALPVPCNNEKEVPVVFPLGQLRPGSDKELPNKQKKWAVPGSAIGNSIYIPESFIITGPVEDEDGELKGKEDREHRQVSENEKPHVNWNTERRCYLEAAAVKALQESVARNRYWPVEIFRLPHTSGGKTRKIHEDEGALSFHGVAFLNLAPLLYPGVKQIHGAYKVLPYTDYILFEKTKRRMGIGEDAIKIALHQLNRSSASPTLKKAGIKEKEDPKKDAKKGVAHSRGPDVKKDLKKVPSSILKSDTGSEGESQIPVNVEGQQYADANSYLMIDITLSRPLVPKRPPEELAKRVAELIPPRPAFPKRTNCAEKAVEDYHEQIASMAALILEDFRDQFGKEMQVKENLTNEAMMDRQQKLMYDLNSSGKYFAFKEQLKHSVIKIVREKYLKTIDFDDREQLQEFLSEMYMYLVDQMHNSMNKFLQIEDQTPIPEPLTTSAQLKHFAYEAEINKNFDLATKYYLERIMREEENADNWFDFGIFCMLISDVAKAEECFSKCISNNQRHMDGLMLYGVVCTLAERNEDAETFFEAATNVDPKSILAWTMLGLFYDAIGNDIGAEMAFLEANKLNVAEAVAVAKAAREDELEKEEKAKKAEKDKEGELTEGEIEHLLISSGLVVRALDSKVNTSGGIATPITSTSARSFTAKGVDKIPSATKRKTSSRNSSVMKGGVRGTPVTGDKESSEETPPHESTPIPPCSIFMHAVDWLLEVKAIPFSEQALAHELLTTTSGKTLHYNIAMAKLRLQKEEYGEAVESLNEALQVEHQNPDVWALMGHVKYLCGDSQEAKECYERTLSFIKDASEMHSIYLRLASIYLLDREYMKAKNTFLMACKKSPSCVSWLGVGIACYRLGELGEAEDALTEANILNNTDAEVWGYLSLVCLRTARKMEAEQSFKHAMMLQLEDKRLVNEIHAEQAKVGFGNPHL